MFADCEGRLERPDNGDEDITADNEQVGSVADNEYVGYEKRVTENASRIGRARF